MGSAPSGCAQRGVRSPECAQLTHARKESGRSGDWRAMARARRRGRAVGSCDAGARQGATARIRLVKPDRWRGRDVGGRRAVARGG